VIEVYITKCSTGGKYDPPVLIQIPTAEVSFTRGNKYKIFKDSFRIDIRKYSFSSRIVNIWNSLPGYVVDVDSVDLFKTRLDNFWRCQDVVYNWTADLAGIGDRSECAKINK